MKKIIAKISLGLLAVGGIFALSGCAEKTNTQKDISAQNQVANDMAQNQPTPTDIEYSLERYNLIRRAYWVNGEREKALLLPCPVQKPLGYIYLISMGTVIAQFTVDGKVTSLAKYLTPDYYYLYEHSAYREMEMADVDGTYGNEFSGIFFFTADGKYVQWSGDYLYSDIPFNAKDTVLE